MTPPAVKQEEISKITSATSIPINLLVLVGVPLLSFITTYAASNFRLASLENRVLTIESQLDSKYVRLETFNDLKERLDKMDGKLDRLLEEKRVIDGGKK